MMRFLRHAPLLPVLLASLIFSGCGGGGGSSQPVVSPITQELGAPQATGNAATDSINWFNFRRQQASLPTLSRNAMIDAAALGHSNYQVINGITHQQINGNPSFTGVTPLQRLNAAGYQFTQPAGLVGEVIVRSNDPSGINGAENLITAIYHRFVIFEPVFREVGAGVASDAIGNIYVTTDFAVNGITAVLGAGNIVTYPAAGQQRVPRNFLSDNEQPDPVPDRNEVGYPISVHADGTGAVTVQSFTVRPQGGAVLAVQLLERTSDPHMLTTGFTSAAAIVPLNALAPATTYDVQFIGIVDGINVNRSWSFTTK